MGKKNITLSSIKGENVQRRREMTVWEKHNGNERKWEPGKGPRTLTGGSQTS